MRCTYSNDQYAGTLQDYQSRTGCQILTLTRLIIERCQGARARSQSGLSTSVSIAASILVVLVFLLSLATSPLVGEDLRGARYFRFQSKDVRLCLDGPKAEGTLSFRLKSDSSLMDELCPGDLSNQRFSLERSMGQEFLCMGLSGVATHILARPTMPGPLPEQSSNCLYPVGPESGRRIWSRSQGKPARTLETNQGLSLMYLPRQELKLSEQYCGQSGYTSRCLGTQYQVVLEGRSLIRHQDPNLAPRVASLSNGHSQSTPDLCREETYYFFPAPLCRSRAGRIREVQLTQKSLLSYPRRLQVALYPERHSLYRRPQPSMLTRGQQAGETSCLKSRGGSSPPEGARQEVRLNSSPWLSVGHGGSPSVNEFGRYPNKEPHGG